MAELKTLKLGGVVMFKNINGLEYLVGNGEINEISKGIFNQEICDFLNDLSILLQNHKLAKSFSDLRTLSFWCRKQNLYNLKKKFKTDEIRVGLGLIFHVTPSNIPTNFAYSLIFGLITGNANVVKVPSKKFEQISIICSCLNNLIKKKKYSALKKKILVIRYKSNHDFTKLISSNCNSRVIWGGDKSISAIKKFPVREKCLDVTFPDKYSLSMINSSKVLKLNDYEIKLLVRKFYNDTFVVDQNACSSPHLVVWIGKDYKKAKNIFWQNLKHFVSTEYKMPAKASVDKFTQLCENILTIKNIKSEKRFGNLIYTIELKELDDKLHTLRGKWGYFFEYNTNDIKNLTRYFNDKYQTLTYFGFNKKYFKNFFNNKNFSGIDRVVPIGQALDIGLIWDGYDISKMLSKIIDIK